MSIALFFKQRLGAKLKTPLYTLSYEKRHYEITQESEMFVMVQYWDKEENKVKVPYVSPTFLGHSTAADLMDKHNKVIKHLYPEKLYQISMDGPALNEFKLYREENAFHSITDIGTCSLHTVHR